MKQKKIKVYLASGWFKPGEPEQEEKIYKTLKKYKKLDIFSPRRNQVAGKSMFEVKDNTMKIAQFEIDCEEIDNADVVVADYTFRDSGTIWEIGYAYKANKPILVFDNIRLNGRRPNLMIAFCSKLGYTNDFDSFNDKLSQFNLKNYKFIDERMNIKNEVQ